MSFSVLPHSVSGSCTAMGTIFPVSGVAASLPSMRNMCLSIKNEHLLLDTALPRSDRKLGIQGSGGAEINLRSSPVEEGMPCLSQALLSTQNTQLGFHTWGYVALSV